MPHSKTAKTRRTACKIPLDQQWTSLKTWDQFSSRWSALH